MADECIFCQIGAGKIPCFPIYQDDQFLAFLDISPVNEGHCLLIPKRHFSRLDQCPAGLLAGLAQKLTDIAPAVVKAVGADGYNVLNNNGRCAGQLVEHIHFHIIPRRQGDGILTGWPAKQYRPGRIEQIADKIKQLL